MRSLALTYPALAFCFSRVIHTSGDSPFGYHALDFFFSINFMALADRQRFRQSHIDLGYCFEQIHAPLDRFAIPVRCDLL
jgi:hypothetical protein